MQWYVTPAGSQEESPWPGASMLRKDKCGGSSGASVSKVPALSCQPCMPRIGRTCFGPYHLPAMWPHGTGMLTSSYYNVCIKCIVNQIPEWKWSNHVTYMFIKCLQRVGWTLTVRQTNALLSPVYKLLQQAQTSWTFHFEWVHYVKFLYWVISKRHCNAQLARSPWWNETSDYMQSAWDLTSAGEKATRRKTDTLRIMRFIHVVWKFEIVDIHLRDMLNKLVISYFIKIVLSK